VERARFEEQLRAFPTKPGVYLFKNAAGKVIYVGKASSLRHRVRSYFSTAAASELKPQKIVSQAQGLDFIVTDSEQEALILENTLIKRHRPRHNVRLRDDKSYPYIKVSLNEKWPRVFVTRRLEEDGARYFGPYANARSVRRTLDLLRRLFRFCSPRSPITGTKARPCFDFFIDRCAGACSGEIANKEYRQTIAEIVLFLEGKRDIVVRQLRRRMEATASALDFEKAAYLRDQLQAVGSVVEEQKASSAGRGDVDAIALARDRNEACALIFFIRSGKIIGKEDFALEGAADEDMGQIIASFLKQYYGSAPHVPGEVLVQTEPLDVELIGSWLGSKRGRRVNLIVPRRGERRKLMDMVSRNAAEALEQMQARWLGDRAKTTEAVEDLQERLRLQVPPRRIECYDISDVRGTSAVGSMVVFEDGRPKASGYRRFKIRTVAGIDDYAMMQEVLRRRFGRLGQQDGTSWAATPDLVLIDGGKGHLSSALDVMHELGIDTIPIASLAKENEELFLPDKSRPLLLPRTSPALYLLQRVRDEAHRFALSYHVRVRRKAAMASVLDLPGIGPKRRRALMKRFGSVGRIRTASVEELAAVPGMSRALAESVRAQL
jgi:excinuclease ABC subunit C